MLCRQSLAAAPRLGFVYPSKERRLGYPQLVSMCASLISPDTWESPTASGQGPLLWERYLPPLSISEAPPPSLTGGDGEGGAAEAGAVLAGEAAAGVGDGDEVPFVLEMPGDLAGLTALLEGRSRAGQCTVLERLVACHSVSLSPHNKPRLERLFDLLSARIHALAEPPPPVPPLAARLPALHAALDGLFRLAAAGIADHAVARSLARIHAIRDALDAAHASPAGPAWPAGGDLVLLRAMASLFPTTDFEHPVATPALLLLAQLLAHCPVRSRRDAAAALWVAALAHEATAPAGRAVPEVVTCLSSVMVAALSPQLAQLLPPTHPAHAALASWAVYPEAPPLAPGQVRRSPRLNHPASPSGYAPARDYGCAPARDAARPSEGGMSACCTRGGLWYTPCSSRSCLLSLYTGVPHPHLL